MSAYYNEIEPFNVRWLENLQGARTRRALTLPCQPRNCLASSYSSAWNTWWTSARLPMR